MNNMTNISKDKRLTPVYDLIVGPFFKKARKRAISMLNLISNDEILMVGVGTIRIDKSKKMLEQGILPIDVALQAGFTDRTVSQSKYKAG